MRKLVWYGYATGCYSGAYAVAEHLFAHSMGWAQTGWWAIVSGLIIIGCGFQKIGSDA